MALEDYCDQKSFPKFTITQTINRSISFRDIVESAIKILEGDKASDKINPATRQPGVITTEDIRATGEPIQAVNQVLSKDLIDKIIDNNELTSKVQSILQANMPELFAPPEKNKLEMSLDEIFESVALKPKDSAFWPFFGNTSDYNKGRNVFIDGYSCLIEQTIAGIEDLHNTGLISPTRKEAQQMADLIALRAKLYKVRDFLRDGWKPDWDSLCDKWCIYPNEDTLFINSLTTTTEEFTFQNEAVTKRFRTLMKSELKQYFHLTRGTAL